MAKKHPRKLYEDFHGKKPSGEIHLGKRAKNTRTFVLLGKAVALVAADHDDRRTVLRFSTGTSVFASSGGKKVYLATRSQLATMEGSNHAGRAISLDYKSNKRNGGGDGRVHVFRHTFSPSTKLFVDNAGRALWCAGPRLYVSDRGIVN